MSLAHAEKLAPAPPRGAGAPPQKPLAAAPAPSSSSGAATAGGVHFVPAGRRSELCAELTARRYVVAPVASPARGRLRHTIDDAVEGVLALRGALPPAVGPDASIEPTIRDQVFRARALGAAGLVLSLAPFGDSAEGGVLDLLDGVALAAWLSASRRAPLLVLLDESDSAARVLAPVSLGELAGPSPLAASDSAPPASGEALTSAIPAPAPPPVPPPPVLTMPRRGVMRRRSLQADAPPSEPAPVSMDLRHVASLMPAVTPLDPPPVVEVQAAEPEPPPVITPEPPSAVTPEPPSVVEAAVEDDLPPPPPAPRASGGDGAAARRVIDAASSRAHAMELDKARGPKPVSVIERLFVSRYLPLLGAVARGEVDVAVRSVVDGWRTAFEHSYRDAFAALRVTGKRPPMVFDVPEIAARVARLNGARATKLLLVDAMRYDVGERVADRLKERLTGRAVCVERFVLWSALPTTTPTQMALLGRGPEGMRDVEPASDPEPEIARGRAVGTLRRERAGSREIMKLDLCEARLRTAGGGYDERLDSLAEEVAPILLKYIEALPPRTVLFLFGDHGFRLPSSADGRLTGPATQGGLSPEEVLVPGQAWLVGGVH